MRTIIYIDHFNFYFGLLKSSEYKWLDYYKLFLEEIMPSRNQALESLKVKFFSSDIKANFHQRGHDAAHAQDKFFRALKFHIGDHLEVYKGKYLTSPMSAYPYSDTSKKKPHSFETQQVWKIEEKLTDVSLAVNAYRDVAQGICDQIVICSNDSDISPALKLIKEDFPNIIIGIVYPIKKEGSEGRRTSAALNEHCNWKITGISNESLQRSQMPNRIQTGKKPIDKPAHW